MGIKPSKKFAVGTIHENGSGKLEVLKRYLDAKTDTVMIEYRSLENDIIKTNTENNLSASIWKFQKLRGQTTTQKVYAKLEDAEEIKEVVDRMEAKQEEIYNLIVSLVETVHIQQGMLDTLVRDNNNLEKLIDKIG